jgi:isopenicillin N synthase-like dioxygenase
MSELPIIDLAKLMTAGAERQREVDRLRRACREIGFFCVVGHLIPSETTARLEHASRRFFALPEAEKASIAMSKGGRAWRGWFPVGDELTSGHPDQKEGIYFGTELGPDDPRVVASLPLHGANLFPRAVPELKNAVTDFMQGAIETAAVLLGGIAQSLGLETDYFASSLTRDPTVLFRIFHYPVAPAGDDAWGVGEHTDYGLLTLLHQDDQGGLEVKSRAGWIDVPPIEGALVCNLGDMLDRLTGGFYRSTPHRAKNRGARGRLSFPLFYDPGFDAEIVPLPAHTEIDDDFGQRWDRASVHAFEGTYGDYLKAKVARVFPDLGKSELTRP